MQDLGGKVAMITGASRGIGAAAAHTLSRYGASVLLLARTEKEIRQHSKVITDAGGKADAFTCDVSQYDEVQKAVEFCIEQFGSLDILVNNAGVIEPISLLAESDPKIWSQTVDINVKGVYYGMRCAIPLMEKQGSGVVINISSGAATHALEGWSHYCATKAAAKMLTEAGHKEYADKGVRVVGLSPGTVATDMQTVIKQSGINPVSQLDWSAHIPAEWVGEAIAFLCTDGGRPFDGTDFSLKTDEGRKLVGLVE
ncbi:MAG: SDR family oxidoreductase [Granulosicoccus sp.]|nr:SDR family oxidoreductase [Granulosicoccus sp.]